MNFVLADRPAIGAAANFELVSDFEPAGDQPQAISEIIDGINAEERDQVLLGVTGSGKTFTMAKVIQTLGRPTLILAPNPDRRCWPYLNERMMNANAVPPRYLPPVPR